MTDFPIESAPKYHPQPYPVTRPDRDNAIARISSQSVHAVRSHKRYVHPILYLPTVKTRDHCTYRHRHTLHNPLLAVQLPEPTHRFTDAPRGGLVPIHAPRRFRCHTEGYPTTRHYRTARKLLLPLPHCHLHPPRIPHRIRPFFTLIARKCSKIIVTPYPSSRACFYSPSVLPKRRAHRRQHMAHVQATRVWVVNYGGPHHPRLFNRSSTAYTRAPTIAIQGRIRANGSTGMGQKIVEIATSR